LLRGAAAPGRGGAASWPAARAASGAARGSSSSAHTALKRRAPAAALPPSQVLPALREGAAAGAPPPGGWWATPADSLTTSVRECGALARLGGLRLLAPLLRPDALLAVPRDAVARLWPPELSDAVADAGFNAYLRSRQGATLGGGGWGCFGAASCAVCEGGCR
jgi:hypothetical protein